jgi:hypothetical protein
MARRLGSARMSKTDSTLCIYPARNIRVKGYKGKIREGTAPLKPKGGMNGAPKLLREGGWVLWFVVGRFGDVGGDLLEDEFAD